MNTEPITADTKANIALALDKAFGAVHHQIASISVDTYRQQSGKHWSPAEQLEHLILATVPIVGALGKDRQWFDQFGPATYPEQNYADLLDYYRKVLATGLKAPARFTPGEHQLFNREKQLAGWQRLETVLKLLLPAKSPDFAANRKLFFTA